MVAAETVDISIMAVVAAQTVQSEYVCVRVRGQVVAEMAVGIWATYCLDAKLIWMFKKVVRKCIVVVSIIIIGA